MADVEAFYRRHLNQEFDRRQRKNPRYSQRAFSRSLNIDNGYLSKLLTGKILLSLDLAEALSKKLKLSAEIRKKFILSAAEEQQCHALYLIDPDFTQCDASAHQQNLTPKPRGKKDSI